MSVKQVVWRVLNKAGTSFIEPATEDKQEEIRLKLADIEAVLQSGDTGGVFDYSSGVDGEVLVPTGARVNQIQAANASTSIATIQINTGDLIEIPPNSTWSIDLKGTAEAPTITFTGTSHYFVGWTQ